MRVFFVVIAAHSAKIETAIFGFFGHRLNIFGLPLAAPMVCHAADLIIGNKKGSFVFTNGARAVSRAEWEGAQPKVLFPDAEKNNLTARVQADMASDSWLSKNIRPMALIAIFVAFFLFTMMSAFGYNAQESYVQLLGQWGQIIFLAYFGGRTVEKLADMRSKK